MSECSGLSQYDSTDQDAGDEGYTDRFQRIRSYKPAGFVKQFSPSRLQTFAFGADPISRCTSHTTRAIDGLVREVCNVA